MSRQTVVQEDPANPANPTCSHTRDTTPKQLMDTCNWNATTIDKLYSAGQIAVGLGFLPGWIFEQLGVRWACSYAALLLTFGSVMFSLGLPHGGSGGQCSDSD